MAEGWGMPIKSKIVGAISPYPRMGRHFLKIRHRVIVAVDFRLH